MTDMINNVVAIAAEARLGGDNGPIVGWSVETFMVDDAEDIEFEAIALSRRVADTAAGQCRVQVDGIIWVGWEATPIQVIDGAPALIVNPPSRNGNGENWIVCEETDEDGRKRLFCEV